MSLTEAMPALGKVPSGLFVLTVRHGNGEAGLLASWVQQCSFEPPQVTVAVKRGRDVLGWLAPGAAFTLNVLAEGQNAMVGRFARGPAPGQSMFDGLPVDRPDGGAPVLKEALAYLVCRVTGRCNAGDHELVVAEVIDGRMLGDGKPWIHLRKTGGNY